MTAHAGPPSLLDADARCLDAAELLLDSLERMPSAMAWRRFLDTLETARALLARDDADIGGLDPALLPLFRSHLESSWSALEAVARARFEWPRRDPSEALDALAGPRAIDRLEEAASRIDHEGLAGYITLRARYRAGRVPASSPEARGRLEEAAARLARLLKAWLAAREGEWPGLDAQVVLGPADAERSWYEPDRHRVVLGPGEFMLFGAGGDPSVNPAIAIQALVHELAGHARQDAASRDLPEPLRPDQRARLRFASLPAAEGYASWRAALSVPFADQHRDELGLGARDLDMLRLLVEMTPAHHLVHTIVGVMAWRAKREPGFDAAARLASLGLTGCGEILERAASQPLYRLLYSASCYFGLLAMREAAEGMPPEAAGRLACGGWALGCLRAAAAAARG